MTENRKIMITSGVNPGQGEQPYVAPRLESHDFVKPENEKQFSLFIQALQRFFDRKNANEDGNKEDQDDSHFRVAGIHGLPYEQWNLAGPKDTPKVPSPGYCQHATSLFVTWHRPYVALWEQILVQHAIDIASHYEIDRPEWQKAASDLRLPYWDWAVHRYPPKQFYDSRVYAKVHITRKDGSPGSVDNPLLQYNFDTGRGPAGKDSKWDLNLVPHTVRHPTRNAKGSIDEKSISNIEEFENGLKNGFDEIRRSTARLFGVDDWLDFSTKAAVPDHKARTASLENIHDTMHDHIGGDGHMSSTATAAFDPIFWLHHCNVDRILALWQGVHPTTWVAPLKARRPNRTTPEDTLLRADTQLVPFRDPKDESRSTYWTSDGCRYPQRLQYTYPDFHTLDLDNAAAVSQTLGRRVHTLYYDKDTFAAWASLREPIEGEEVNTAESVTSNSFARQPADSMLLANRRPRESIEWAVRVRGKLSDLCHTTAILICIGGRPENGVGYSSDEHYAGSFNPFPNPFSTQCENCVSNNDTVVEGFVSITATLMKQQPNLNVLDIPAVEEYLRQNLYWIPRNDAGKLGRPEDVPSLEVTVIDTPLTAHEDEDFPVVGTLRKHNEVTFDQPGGRVHLSRA